MSVLSPDEDQEPFPFALDQRIEASKLLLDAILLLSSSSLSTPLPRLPLDILYLIFPHVATDPDLESRRDTLHSLLSTSKDWRKIALPTWNSQVIIHQSEQLVSWCDSDHFKTLDSSTLEFLHIDVSGANSDEIKSIMQSPMGEDLEKRGVRIKHITLDMQIEMDEMDPEDDGDLCCWMYMFLFTHAVDYTVKVPA